MTRAALPDYLGTTFEDASPGLRFGLCLDIWTPDWKVVKGADARCAMAPEFPRHSQAAMAALADRQRLLAEGFPGDQLLTLEAECISPFATGLGNEHPTENGFAFLTPYGLPYLPGSGVKGVVRRAAMELSGDEWGGPAFSQASIDVLFGDSPDEPSGGRRGALSFWDVIPQIPGSPARMQVEIMTPHASHYYRNEPVAGSASPHDSGAPNPILFLTVPPKTRMTFHVACQAELLARHAPDLLAREDGEQGWKRMLQACFRHAFDWIGFGAKKAVGYGAMGLDAKAFSRAEERRRQAEQEAQRKKAEAERARKQAEMDPPDRLIQQVLDAKQAGQDEMNALFKAAQRGAFKGELEPEIAARLKARMQQSNWWRPQPEKKKAEKDDKYQFTLLVLRMLEGK